MPLFLFITSGFVFGAAKPVPINYWALRNPKRDIVLVGISGPLANFILGGLLAIVIKIAPLPVNLLPIIVNLIVINVVLGVFNLVPIPPLDGSRILMGLLPEPLASQYAGIESYSFVILLILIWLGALNRIVWPAVEFILRLMGV